MFELSDEKINFLCELAKLADKEIRSDLSLGMIINENDYTSNFTGAFRRNINCYSKDKIKAMSQNLPKKIEQRTNCDATIIIYANGYAKIVMFEAKWPRINIKSYKWDYEQTASGLSHFSDQLDRQANYSSCFAIFEMFYCEFPFLKQPEYMKDYFSSCVWHDDTIQYKKDRSYLNAIWSQKDLINMLQNTNSYDIGQILDDVCRCKKGKVHKIDGVYESIDGLIEEFRIDGEILIIRFT